MSDAEETCTECEGEGTIEVNCSCYNTGPAYNCQQCGNCGLIEVLCPECADPTDYDGPEPDDDDSRSRTHTTRPRSQP